MKQYVFINTPEAMLPKAGPDRLAIRQQAMRDAVLARKRRGCMGRNYGQIPEFLLRNQDEGSGCPPDIAHDNCDTKQWESLVRRPFPTHNKAIRRLTLLSPLTTLHINRTTANHLPQLLLSLLTTTSYDHHQWSFTLQLPRVYGRRSYLDSAIDCLDAKLEEVLLPSEEPAERSRWLYLKALQDFRAALGDESECSSAEMLCTGELLALWEVGFLNITIAERLSLYLRSAT